MDEGPQLGRLIEDGDLRRDAIHIAVAPVTSDSGYSFTREQLLDFGTYGRTRFIRGRRR
jgi:hypothetical protein